MASGRGGSTIPTSPRNTKFPSRSPIVRSLLLSHHLASGSRKNSQALTTKVINLLLPKNVNQAVPQHRLRHTACRSDSATGPALP